MRHSSLCLAISAGMLCDLLHSCVSATSSKSICAVGCISLFSPVHLISYLYIQFGYTALYYASKRGKTEIVKLLLERGADVNIQTKVMCCTR